MSVCFGFSAIRIDQIEEPEWKGSSRIKQKTIIVRTVLRAQLDSTEKGRTVSALFFRLAKGSSGGSGHDSDCGRLQRGKWLSVIFSHSLPFQKEKKRQAPLPHQAQ